MESCTEKSRGRMKVKMKKVYYCEFCKKHGLRSLKKHEERCTKNLDRNCRMCYKHPDYRSLVEKYNKQFVIKEKSEDDLLIFANSETIVDFPDINNISDDVEGCPACILTIIRNLDYSYCFNYDYKEASKRYFEDQYEEAE